MMALSNHKKLSLLGASLLIITAILASIQIATPHTLAASATCPDITGQGVAIPVDGVPNAGILDFSNAMPAFQYQACLEDNGTNGQGPFLVKGWTWDTNLGWVSFFCDDEDNNPATEHTNLGRPCGNVQYGVTMDGPASGTFGMLHEYAWGDNTGWISFNCADLGICATAPYFVQAEPTDPACVGKVFDTDAACPSVTHPLESTFAWSDNVGWLDLTNIVFPINAVLNPQPIEDIEALFEITPNPLGLPQESIPWADGADGYDLTLYLYNKADGTGIDPSLYTIQTEVIWAEDSVDLDQTDATQGDYKACGGSNCGAVTKPLILHDQPYGQAVRYGFRSKVTSVAPTSDQNGTADGSMLFKDFILGHDDVPESNLVISQVKVSVLQNEQGTCLIGDANNNCSPEVIWDGNQLKLPFKPAVSVNQLNVNDPISTNTLEAQYNVAKEIKYTTSCHNEGNEFANADCNGASIHFQTGVDSPFDLVIDTDNNGATCNDLQAVRIPTHLPWAEQEQTFQITPVFESMNGDCALTGPPVGNNTYIYSTVSYSLSGKNVNYFSNKLPRVEGTLVVNPIANIKGQVYSQGVTNPQSGKEIRSLGDISTNILRNTLSRNVSSIVAGVDAPEGNASIKGYDPNSGFIVDNNNAVRKILTDDKGVPQVYYFKGDVTLDIGSDLSWEGQRSIFIEGGDLIIKSNIYNPPSGPYVGELGIIVLKDLRTGEGGNIFVGPEVTNIQATMYADKSFFSFDGTAQGFTGNTFDEPLFTDEAQRFNTLKNQLYIQGSLASMNTLGGAVANPPFIGNGTITSPVEGEYGQMPLGRRRARLYDLNFLRYYGLVFERDSNGNAVDKDNDSQLEATPYTGNASGGDLIVLPEMKTAQGLDRDKDFSPVYITFKPPSATLPGFGVTKGIDVKVRP